MNADKQAQKNELRVKIRAAVKGMPPEKRKSDSEKICALLREQSFLQSVRSILFFAPLPEEPNLWPVLVETMLGKTIVALPCFDADNQVYQPRRVTDLHVQIISGKFGIREPSEFCVPIPPNDLDLVLVPGVAFGLDGHRLGRGKGYYDRLLQSFSGTKVGVAFEEQIVEVVPSEANDVRMDVILTPTRSVKLSR